MSRPTRKLTCNGCGEILPPNAGTCAHILDPSSTPTRPNLVAPKQAEEPTQ